MSLKSHFQRLGMAFLIFVVRGSLQNHHEYKNWIRFQVSSFKFANDLSLVLHYILEFVVKKFTKLFFKDS